MPYKSGSWGPDAKLRAQKRLEWFRKYNLNRDPLKKGARRLVERALKNGTLKKLPCQVCNSTKRVEGHHDDYSKPLEVIWLCPTHHRELHLNREVIHYLLKG